MMNMDADARERYLGRIGYEGNTAPDLPCLERLMEYHLQNVVFENLEVYEEGRVPSLDTEDLYRKIVLQGRGGYCFELNKLFYEILKAVGFQVYPLGVRILWNREQLPPMTHRATLVTLEDGIYYCDIGYGGPGPKRPVRLEDGIHEEKGGSFRITMKPEGANGESLIERKREGSWTSILRFPLHPALEVDFELMNFYCARSPQVMFTQKRVLSRNTSDGSVALTGNVLSIQKADGSLEYLEGKTDAAVRGWIRDYFGIREES